MSGDWDWDGVFSSLVVVVVVVVSGFVRLGGGLKKASRVLLDIVLVLDLAYVWQWCSAVQCSVWRWMPSRKHVA